MLSRINTEHEVRMVTDVNGLRAAKRWFSKRYNFHGANENFRSHLYYDLPDGVLAEKNRSFRQSVGKYAYCLKYPVRSEGSVITRREVFCKLSGPLDLLHPYHQRLGISVRLLSLLSAKRPVSEALLRRFKPRIQIDCRRDYRIILYPDGIDRMLAVAFDSVCAYDSNAKTDRPFASWCEVELETIWAFPERVDVAMEIARGLAREGLRTTFSSKYHIAAGRLATHA